MFYLVMLNSWQNRPKTCDTIPLPSRGSGVTPVEAPPNWHQHWLRFSWMIQKCCGDTPDGSKVRHCSLFEHAWGSVKQCFFPRGAGFPEKSKLEGSTFEYICRFTSGPTTRSTPCAFFYHLYDLRWLDASLTHTARVAPKGTVLGADRHFWTVRCVVRGWKLKWKVQGGGFR